jgi:hypothetical protein
LLHANFAGTDIIAIQEGETMTTDKLVSLCPELANSYMFYDPTERNGVCTFVSRHVCHDVCHFQATREWQLFVFKLNKHVQVFINLHLPDDASWERRGISYRDVLSRLSDALAEVHASWPWSNVTLCGDLNSEFTPGGEIGECVSGLVHGVREQNILEWARGHLLDWKSTHMDPGNFTHIHHVTKQRAVLDYVLNSCTVPLTCFVHVAVDYDKCFDSDHMPIVFEVGVFGKSKNKNKYARAARVSAGAHRMTEIAVQNRYAALVVSAMEAEPPELQATSHGALEAFSSCLVRCQQRAIREVHPPCGEQSLKEFCEIEIDALNEAAGGDRRVALRALNATKKQFFKKRARERLIGDVLRAPREGTVKTGGAFAIQVNGVLSKDPAVWQPAVTEVYTALFRDDDNPSEAHAARLADLRAQALGEQHLHVPLCLIHEHLSRGRPKAKTTGGLDGLVWSSLTNLPYRACIALRVIVEARVNALPCSIGVIGAWHDVLVHLIPKTQNPTHVAHWRPISLSSVFQKLYLSITTALLNSYDCLDPLQRGFRPGGQTMEVCETIRYIAKKSHEWNTPFYALKLDVARAFDNIKWGCLDGAMERAGICSNFRHAVLQELPCRMRFSCMGTVWDGLSPSKGGRQGGCDMPFLWNALLVECASAGRPCESQSAVEERRLGLDFRSQRRVCA